ncbi:uncharacterized protein I303_108297 [Kwoniella dejecticola CBS 10117]|uniref:Uncharacterized protein n=1 Tax=Kwoniella dejecticola CBS 10117 TaxID=1296121 RepID=A0A1A5ZXT0_9TREE|nr:uncharacterized protein I303_07376 [Kwoniella dejecticola CBS 10117]OBR82614.1 hypothetical protein I303_07376 [Kwoniella dejecticola CBS 10117]
MSQPPSGSSSSQPIPTRPRTTRPDRRPILPGPISRSAKAQAQAVLHSPKEVPTVELGGKKSLFQSFRSLNPNTRILFGVIVGIVGIAGLMVDRNVLQDDKAETSPGGISVRMVDRKPS